MKKILTLGMVFGTMLLATQVEVEAARRNRNDCRVTGTCRDRGNSRADRDRSDARARRDARNARRNDRVNRDRPAHRTDRVNRNRPAHRTDRVNRNRPAHRTDRAYRTYRHRPNRAYRNHNRRFRNSRDYHRTINRQYVYRNNWLRVSVGYDNGYRYYNDYPFFVYNGYRHRYSHVDTCNYELVDSYTGQIERRFHTYTCSTGYDLCANKRDDLNEYEWDNRYFCAEKYSNGFDDSFGDTYYEDDSYSYNSSYYDNY
ncbi:MAG: hypothetical protein BM556_16145 [Bacteriovorax sp. MedPE-SWde]|nr:MAG: hypothetical protein BM556_16145 [Bacteriovorax sp. MedPE-SWde]